MFVTMLDQKEASPRAMEQRRSLGSVDFLPSLKPLGVPESRHEGRLSGKGTLGKKAVICRDGRSFTQEHYTVLRNSTFVAPYIEEHRNVVRSKFPGNADSWIEEKHMETFR